MPPPEIEIHACFKTVCPLSWHKLDKTSQLDVRHCQQCQRSVYLCANQGEVDQHARQGHCVAVLQSESPDNATHYMLGEPDLPFANIDRSDSTS